MVYVLSYALIVFAVILRLVPHPANFAPIAALALFGGVYLNRKIAIIIPLAAMLISDYAIGLYSYKIMLSVYGSFVLVGLIGLWLRNHKSVVNVVGASLFGSVLFYLITNFAVWAFGTLYPKTLTGLLTSYTMAIPFFRNTILGDMFYTGLLFGTYELVRYLATRRAGTYAMPSDS